MWVFEPWHYQREVENIKTNRKGLSGLKRILLNPGVIFMAQKKCIDSFDYQLKAAV
jgi:hypothetical protein